MRRRARCHRDALIGAALALGAPLGLLLVRATSARRPSLAWALAEVAADASTYAYVTLSTLIAFALFGMALGRQADRLFELSSRDSLTGLGNRRTLQVRLEEEFARVLRYGSPLSVLVIDLDGLKEVNDRLGHRAGDDALVRVAAAISDGSRGADVAARWGGDEFVLLAPSTGPDDALRLAERVRLQVSQDARGLPRTTVSIGVATASCERPLRFAHELLVAADAALYAAKSSGRDRIAVA